MRKTLFALLLSMTLVTGLLFSSGSNNYAQASSQAEIAMELTTGKVLTQSNADARMPMASTTKIMTALIIIEDCNLNEIIKVPKEAVGVEGSSIYLKNGEEIDIRDLLYGLMLRSGNDSAVTLAIHHSGSIEKFAESMNKKAKEIGANNTNFKNPSGLPDSDHYTTASDLCKIACYAMRNAQFKEIVSTKEYKGKYKEFSSKNKMLRLYEGANGVKTGYTVKAGRCLVSSAERNGMDVVSVVLNCPDMYERSAKILDYCFDNYKLLKIGNDKVFMSGDVLCKLPESIDLVVKSNEDLRFQVSKIVESEDGAVAELKIYCENDLLFKEKLYSI